MMNAQTIQDSVNKYRYGVLIGNYNEETFGKDLKKTETKPFNGQSIAKSSYTLENAAYNVIVEKPSFKEQEFNDLVKNQSNPMNSKLLFGHGLNQNDFEKRQMTTSYDLSYNRLVKPQTQIFSKYEPQPTLNANIPKKEQVTEKITNIKDYDKDALKQPKKYTHYNEFMKTFDSTNIKIPLRK